MKNFSKLALMFSCLFIPLMCFADVAPMPTFPDYNRETEFRFITYLLSSGLMSLIVLLIILVNYRYKTAEKAEKPLTPFKKFLKIALYLLLSGLTLLSFGLIVLFYEISTILELFMLILPPIAIFLSSIIINIAVEKRNLSNKLLYLVPIAVYLLTTSIAGWVYVYYYEIEDYLLSERCDKCKKYYRDEHSCWYCKKHNKYFDKEHECFYCSYHNDWHIQRQEYHRRRYHVSTWADDKYTVYWRISGVCKAICKTCGRDYTHLIHGREYHRHAAYSAYGRCRECGIFNDDDEQNNNIHTLVW